MGGAGAAAGPRAVLAEHGHSSARSSKRARHVPTLSALQTSVSATDDMLEHAEASRAETFTAKPALVNDEGFVQTVPLQSVPLMLQNATISEGSEGDKKGCGKDGEVQCSDFMKIYTLGYRFDVFWSTVHWTCIFLVFCMCCCCTRNCLFRRRR
mmetsp:Transcript_33147/g.103380  ORF Transcript_33147/g.103380 Transcript_33147/m.103380 type:complete len:154 (-) Transcript_33147:34-495(-)